MKTEAHRSPEPLLTVENLETGIPTERGIVHAVNGVSFALHRGETLAIVGESGCGKSMLCRSVLRLLPRNATIAETSRIRFNRRNLLPMSEREFNTIRGRRIAMILQNPMSALNPVMKIGIQITEAMIHHLRMKPKPAKERAVALLRSAGVSDPEQRMDQYPHQLSGGLQQRVAIAIALACGPELLIADEPTTALDATVQAEFLDLLGRLQRKTGMAVLLITHDLGVAAAMAHDLAVMYAGRIVEKAPARRLLSGMRMPYTQALVESTPCLDQPPHTRLKTIDGVPPNLIRRSKGCDFAPRCVHTRDRCRLETPPIRSCGGHAFACWYPLRPPERSGRAMAAS